MTDNLPSDYAVRQALNCTDYGAREFSAMRAAIRAYLTQTDEGRALVKDAGLWREMKRQIENGDAVRQFREEARRGG